MISVAKNVILEPYFPRAGYDAQAKEKWRKASMRFMRAAAAMLQERGFTVRNYFNPGGIAVSGDAHLLAINASEGAGLEVNVNLDMSPNGMPDGYYRVVEHDPVRNPRYPVGRMGVNHSFQNLFGMRSHGVPSDLLADKLAEIWDRERSGVARKPAVSPSMVSERER